MSIQITPEETGTTRSERLGSHAVVIGGSMAGMLAARVLADHFDRVTIVERDRFPPEASPRKGVPQSQHLHALLLRGCMILEELFPGVQDEMTAAGAHRIDMAADISWLTPAGWGVSFPSNLKALSFTRDFLDWSVRRRLAAIPQVRIMEECEVQRLLLDADGSGVAGALVHSRNHPIPTSSPLIADLIVDASGRASRTAQWLETLGFEPPQETVINAHLGYASRFYRLPEGSERAWKAIIIQTAPPERTRGGLIFPVEGDRWLLTLVGGDRDYPPTDEEGFLEFARSLPSPLIYDAIKTAEPMTAIKSYRATENRLRHYERLTRLPENFIALGDAACAFNPVYGQGMTVAALGALTLSETLREQKKVFARRGLRGLSRRFQKRLARINSGPWMLATSQDFRYCGTEGGAPTAKTRLMHRYMDGVVRLSTMSAEVRQLLLEVFNLSRSPAALFHPRIALRVIAQSFKSDHRSEGTTLRPPTRPRAARAT